jgi:general secretion pathway protein G
MRQSNQFRQSSSGFTLIEMLAIIGIITLVIGVILGTMRHAERKIGISLARAEIGALEMALEAYRADNGFYPLTSDYRPGFSHGAVGTLPGFLAACSNSWVLYCALSGTSLDGTPGKSKAYFQFPPNRLETTFYLGVYGGPGGTNLNIPAFLGVSNGKIFVDNFRNPYIYYRPSAPTADRKNPATFDLWSAGPDGNSRTNVPSDMIDDITNWTQ